MPEEIIVQDSEKGERLDLFLLKKTGITRSQIRKLIRQGDILVNDSKIIQNYRVKPEDFITIQVSEEPEAGLAAEPIPVEVLYEDSHLIIVNKPAGMVVYPAAGHATGTLMNALAHHCSKLSAPGGPLRPGVVHRLDKDTSGVMVIALNDGAYYNLVEQFRQRTINRKYAAIIFGNMKEDSGQIDLRIGRSESDRKKMSTQSRRGKEALTNWKVVQRFGCATVIEVKLGTGRTHQIRVHFASIGHPVLGDRTYGKKIGMKVNAQKTLSFPRQMLHAGLLGFPHPVTGEYLEFSSPLPEDMAEKIAELKDL